MRQEYKALPHINEQFINRMDFLLISFGKDSLIDYLYQIEEIAGQCPTSGGSAVYRARTMLELFQDPINYDNACLQNVSYRNQNVSTKVLHKSKISIIPNLADNKITITIDGVLRGLCKIEITNSLGEIVLSEHRNCKEKSMSVNTKSFTPGIYTVKVIIDDEVSNVLKLVIAR